MNKQLIVILILIFSGCKIFDTDTIKFNKQIITSTIYANLLLESDLGVTTKLKTKIQILKDSIIISAYPILGIELGNVIMTNECIYIDQKITNKTDSVLTNNIDPDFKLNDIKNLFFQTKAKKDTVFYFNNFLNCQLTEYVNYNSVFLPHKIIYWESDNIKNQAMKKSINIDYKSVNF
ncbi:MAG: hypothetical protein CMP49_00755 [Flavobacteriales bacterium]|jgi:hypothetical protein|nr:hypothetical protein [Flavobacteriales bacterium]|tara:strand:+ start:553 stop:1086 length:534 start_codon:yes stop_codon:yes gene_type:complete